MTEKITATLAPLGVFTSDGRMLAVDGKWTWPTPLPITHWCRVSEIFESEVRIVGELTEIHVDRDSVNPRIWGTGIIDSCTCGTNVCTDGLLLALHMGQLHSEIVFYDLDVDVDELLQDRHVGLTGRIQSLHMGPHPAWAPELVRIERINEENNDAR